MTPDIASLLDEETQYENCNILHHWKRLCSKQVNHSPALSINMSIWERSITRSFKNTFIGSDAQLTIDAVDMIATLMENFILQLLSCANRHAISRGSIMVTMKDIENAELSLKM